MGERVKSFSIPALLPVRISLKELPCCYAGTGHETLVAPVFKTQLKPFRVFASIIQLLSQQLSVFIRERNKRSWSLK